MGDFRGFRSCTPEMGGKWAEAKSRRHALAKIRFKQRSNNNDVTNKKVELTRRQEAKRCKLTHRMHRCSRKRYQRKASRRIQGMRTFGGW